MKPAVGSAFMAREKFGGTNIGKFKKRGVAEGKLGALVKHGGETEYLEQ